MQYPIVLVVHDIPMVQNLLNRYIMSEYNNSEVITCASKDLFSNLQKKKYHVILSEYDIEDPSRFKIKELTESSTDNSTTPIIMISSSDEERTVAEFQKYDFTNYLFIPFYASVLKNKINALCDPKTLRDSERLNIEGMEGIIQSGNRDIPVNIKNFNLSGLMCEFDYLSNYGNILSTHYITIRLPTKYDNIAIRNIKARIVRINVSSWDSKESPQKVHVALSFVGFPEKNESLWQENFRRIQKEQSWK